MKKYINIAIDGPSGSGKSSASKKLAEQLGFVYVNTGAMYRAYAYFLKDYQKDISKNQQEVINLLDSNKFVFDGDTVLLNNQDISDIIRSCEVALIASKVAQIPFIRDYATNQQRMIAKNNHVVMDGRDIGTIVLKDADLKIFLDTSVEERARRRVLQNQDIEKLDFNKVLKEIQERDDADRNRAIAPLKPAQDAHVIYNDGMNLETCVNYLLSFIRKNINI